jgi:hypothetical protein
VPITTFAVPPDEPEVLAVEELLDVLLDELPHALSTAAVARASTTPDGTRRVFTILPPPRWGQALTLTQFPRDCPGFRDDRVAFG